MTQDIQSGSPWKHCLQISELGPSRIDAGVDLTQAKWIWPTVGISTAVFLLLGFASFNAFGEGQTAGGIVAAVFACLASVIALLSLGCRTYTVRLKVEGNTITFARRFFWRTKGAKADKGSLGYIRCWSHTIIGSGRGRSHSFHVCLHPSPPLPVLSLFSKEYLPDIRRKVGEMMGMSTDTLSTEQAVQLVWDKADEIASDLEIEHKTGSNN